jgi:hypothetical protein
MAGDTKIPNAAAALIDASNIDGFDAGAWLGGASIGSWKSQATCPWRSTLATAT